MKLIIDIPEEVKHTFDNAENENLYGNYYDYNSLIGKAIRKGSSLDELRSELNNYITCSPYIISFMDCCRLRDDVMRIIDKYKAERSDEE